MPSMNSHLSSRLLPTERHFRRCVDFEGVVPSRAQALREKDARVRHFKKWHSVTLANKLSGCVRGNRCLSGACPLCGRALQLSFIASIQPELTPANGYCCASIIPKVHIAPGELDNFDIASFRDRFIRNLDACKIHYAVGGIDFSLNSYKEAEFKPHWRPHFWIILPRSNATHWEFLLRKKYSASRMIKRAVRIRAWDGSPRALAYALKTDFRRRISMIGTRGQYGERVCAVTTYDRLRSLERFELYSFLDKVGLGARVIDKRIED